jgi:tetratricopeptide (TPR) repeat protein/DNA-binding CsgD family transcriptional regulator
MINRLSWMFTGILVFICAFPCLIFPVYAQQDSLFRRIDSLEKVLLVAPDSCKAVLYNRIGSAFREIGNYEKARSYFNESLHWADKTGVSDVKSSVYLNLGFINMQHGNYLEAITAYQKALRLQEEQGNLKNQARTLDHIGTLYRRTENPGKAEEYFTKSLEIRKRIDDKQGISASLNNIAIISNERGDYTSALDYYFQALRISEETGALHWQANQLHNIGIVYKNLNDPEKAILYFNRAIKIFEETGEKKGLITAYQSLGGIYEKQKEDKRAVEYINKSNKLAQETGMKHAMSDNELALSVISEKNGNLSAALEHFKKYALLRDSILNETNIKTIHELQTRYETRSKEHENDLLRKELEIREQATRAKNAFILLLLITVAALIATTVLLVYYLSMKRRSLRQSEDLLQQEKALRELAEKNKDIEQEMLEERVFAERELTRLQTDKLEYKTRELSSLTLRMLQKNEILENIVRELKRFRESDNSDPEAIHTEILRIIQSNLDLDHDWEQIKLHFQEVHPGFFSKLESLYPDLTQHDLKLCAYLRLNLSTKEIAQLLNVTIAGINKSRQRIRHKLSIGSEVDLVEFMRKI